MAPGPVDSTVSVFKKRSAVNDPPAEDKEQDQYQV